MEKEKIDLQDKATAFGALAVLLAEGIPSGKVEYEEAGAVCWYDLTFPWASLLHQARLSLAKLIETADSVYFSVDDGNVRVRFMLRLAE